MELSSPEMPKVQDSAHLVVVDVKLALGKLHGHGRFVTEIDHIQGTDR